MVSASSADTSPADQSCTLSPVFGHRKMKVDIRRPKQAKPKRALTYLKFVARVHAEQLRVHEQRERELPR